MGALQTTLSSVPPSVGALAHRSNAVRVQSRPAASPVLLQPTICDGGASTAAIRNEQNLIVDSIAGNATSWENLLSTYSSRLYRTAFAILRNREDAEDAVQEGLYNAYRKLHYFQGRSSFSTWLTRIVVNSALMSRRKNNAHPGASLDEMLAARRSQITRQIVDRRPDPETICNANEIKALVEREIEKLPADVRRAVQLHEIEGFSAEESIQSLGIRRSTFKSRILRARRKLKAALRPPVQAPDRLAFTTTAVVRSDAATAGIALYRSSRVRPSTGGTTHREAAVHNSNPFPKKEKRRSSNARLNQAAQ